MADRGITKNELILVTGATGRQGGSVARRLLEDGWKVRVLTRNREKAMDLLQRGAEVAVGNMDDPRSMEKAMAGVQGVYSVQSFWETGVQGEIRQGKLMVDLARRQNVRHFIYSSVGSADRKTGIPHFESKWEIEEYIRQMKLPYTILRPVFFMQNFSTPDMRSAIESGALYMPMNPHQPLQMINVEHVGDFAKLAFEKQLLGQSIDLASDELTIPQAAEIFTRVLGREVKFQEASLQDIGKTMGKDMATMFEWFNRVGYNANIEDLVKKYGIALMDFDTFVEKIWAPRKVGL